MKRSNRLVILVGVLLAVLAFVAIVILLNQREEAVAPEEITETVLVATVPIEIGDPVTPDVVEERAVDPEAVQGSPLRSTTEVLGEPALVAVPAGSQVSEEAIRPTGRQDTDISAQLAPEEKAVSIQLDRVQGLDFLVTPGDTIDVLVSIQLPPKLQELQESVRTVKTVLQNKRVLYVSTSNASTPEPQDTNNDGVIDDQDIQPEAIAEDQLVLIFAGTAQDAEIVRFAQRTSSDIGDLVAGSLSVVVRSADDEAAEETTGISLEQLIEDHGLMIPAVENVADPGADVDVPDQEEPAP